MIPSPNTIKEKFLSEEIDKAIFDNMFNCLEYSFDMSARIKKEFGVDLQDNQQEIVETFVDLSIKNMGLIASRSGGKTFGVIIGMLQLSTSIPISIGITAPSADQATRLIATFTQLMYATPNIERLVVKSECSSTKVVFKNGSRWEAFSGSEVSKTEGRHYDCLVIDEAQDISDYALSNVLLPMIGHSKIGKLVKLGVPRGRSHFYKSSKNSEYTFLAYDWLHCGNLFNQGYIEIAGVKYPKSVISRMPLRKKQEYFPANPELWSDGDMSVEDFESQYEIKWLLNVDNLLKEKDQEALMGDYLPPSNAATAINYYFGLDLAGGSTVKEGGDWTQLVIGHLDHGGVKRIDFVQQWQGDVMEQLSDICDLIHPTYGKYRCKGGLVDLGEMGVAVHDMLKKEGVTLTGVMFQSRDMASGKNMKNAMFDHFLFELRSDRFKYPSKEYCNSNPLFKKHITEWCTIERHIGTGINDKIQAPTGLNDDCCCSTIMFNWYVDKILNATTNGTPKSNYKFPSIKKAPSAYL